MNFFSFKYFCEILNLKNNALIQELDFFNTACKDIKWIEYQVLMLYDREISILDFLKECLKYDGAYSLAIRYVYLLVLSFKDLKCVALSDA